MHPDFGNSLNNIGSVYLQKGNYDKALEYYLKSLVIRKTVLGETHPDYAASFYNIGNTYNKKGDYDKALEYHLKSLEIRKVILG